jgi:hypothetical protein
VEPYDARRQMTAAEEEALTSRWIPRTGTARKRYVAVAAVEEPQDVALPPHRRPALVHALAFARSCTGGLLIEEASDLGRGLQQAAVLKYALATAGFPDLRQVDADAGLGHLPATVTVGFLGKSRGRRSALREDHGLLARHVAGLEAKVRRAEKYDERAVNLELEHLQEAIEGVTTLDGDVAWNAPATSSDVFGDLSYEGAHEYVDRLRAQTSPEEQVLQLLQLFGFLNSKGHRVWHRSELRGLVDRMGSL